MTYRRTTLILLLLLAGMLFFAGSTSAQSKTYYWERFDVDVDVLEDGDLRVTEQQTLNFAGDPFTFGFRNIPVGSSGRNDGITDVVVSQAGTPYTRSSSQQPFTYRIEESGGEATIYWYFPPALGNQTFTISYTVENAVRTESNGDQVFWNAMPEDLGSYILAGEIAIDVPEGVEILATTALVGGAEDNGIATQVSEDGRRAVFTLQRPRAAGTPVEVGVRFPTGILDIATPAWQQAEQVRDVIGLILLAIAALVAIGGPVVALLLWYLYGRDPQVAGAIPTYLAEPPDSTPPAVVGTLIDERAHIHDIMSTLVDLARRGYLTMSESVGDFTFTRTEKPWDDLLPYEKTTLRSFFGRRESRDLEDLKYKFVEKLPGIRKELYDELLKRGYVERSPDTTRNAYGCAGIFLFVLAVAAFIIAMTFFEGSVATAICPAIALGLTAAVVYIVGRYMPAKTKTGAEASARWLAFKTYLEGIEKHRNLADSTEIFERFLPYAIVFGLERSWIRKFSGVPGTPVPPWYFPYFPVYHGRGGAGRTQPAGGGGLPTLEGMSGGLTGSLESMSSGLTRMLTSTQTVLQSTRPSSSSGGGGSFSGGFSGGSSGGGGGGFG